MIAAALFGLALMAASEFARAGRGLAEDPRVSQALAGAGLAILFATAYGSYILYALIGPGQAAAAMVAITLAALALSLDRQRLVRVAAAAEILIPRYAEPGDDIRIDAVLIAPGRLPVHLEHVWQG